MNEPFNFYFYFLFTFYEVKQQQFDLAKERTFLDFPVRY